MEPRIQYAKTTDGVSIAYSTLGECARIYRMTYEQSPSTGSGQAESGDGNGQRPGEPAPKPLPAG